MALNVDQVRLEAHVDRILNDQANRTWSFDQKQKISLVLMQIGEDPVGGPWLVTGMSLRWLLSHLEWRVSYLLTKDNYRPLEAKRWQTWVTTLRLLGVTAQG
jgi:hypothetical protein